MTVFRLGNPFGLFFLILPLLALASFILSRYLFKKGTKITSVSSIPKQFSIFAIGYYFSICCIITGFFFGSFSLSKPQSGVKREKIVSKGLDIMITLDLSASMLIDDFSGKKRIDVAKEIIADFLKKRKGDRIGIVTFAESSMVRSPATLDYDVLHDIIKIIDINPNNKSSQRTALGVGLASAINRLLKLKQVEESLGKIIILVTDGKNNSGEISPETALSIAIQNKIRVYTVGIGDKEEIDFELLKLIAEKTQARFFNANNPEKLEEIFSNIDKLEKHKIESVEFSRMKNIGYYYAVIAFILIILGILLNSTFLKRIS